MRIPITVTLDEETVKTLRKIRNEDGISISWNLENSFLKSYSNMKERKMMKDRK